MAVIRGFRDLEVYKNALVQSRELYIRSLDFPVNERYSLTDQIRRSSRAVGAMIAEGWARRRYKAAFINKINEALGEAMETQAWLDHALACDYLSVKEHRTLDAAWQNIGGMLNRMIDRAESFCPSPSS